MVVAVVRPFAFYFTVVSVLPSPSSMHTPARTTPSGSQRLTSLRTRQHQRRPGQPPHDLSSHFSSTSHKCKEEARLSRGARIGVAIEGEKPAGYAWLAMYHQPIVINVHVLSVSNVS